MNRFYELGGEAWFNCRAEEFLFDCDRVCGVRTNLGDVECRQVLASINPNIIYSNMMPKELVPEDYYKVKDKMIAKCIDDLKKKLNIDITPYIEEVEAATPMTFARYLGTPYGFEVSE